MARSEETHETAVRRLKDQAAAALIERRYADASRHLYTLCEADPEEPGHRMKLAELYLRLARRLNAIDCYREAMALYEKQAAYRKAAAVANILLTHEPHDLEAKDLLRRWQAREVVVRPPPKEKSSPAEETQPPLANPFVISASTAFDMDAVEVEMTAARPMMIPRRERTTEPFRPRIGPSSEKH